MKVAASQFSRHIYNKCEARRDTRLKSEREIERKRVDRSNSSDWVVPKLYYDAFGLVDQQRIAKFAFP